MASLIISPRFWYQGTKPNIGQTVSGYTEKMIQIHYRTEIELDEKDLFEVSSYESDPVLEWEFKVEYYNRNSNSWQSVSTQSKTFYNDSCNTSIYLPVRLNYRNRISCKARISYEKHTLLTDIFDNTDWDMDTEYEYGDKNNLSTVSPYENNFSNFIPSSNIGTTYFYAYPRNYVTSDVFWKNGSVAIATGNYIEDHLTISNLDQWLKQVGIWNSWKQQKNLYDTYGRGGAVSGGDITASWYNTMAGYCGANTVSGLSDVSDTTKATYIAASHFTTLAQKVTTWPQ